MKEVIVGNSPSLLGELVGKGGEGEVFSLKDNAGLAVKIYNESLRSKREDKVRAMVRERLAANTDLVAYPGDIVSDRSGNFLGFIMRFVMGYRPIHELYSPKSRQRHFPNSNYRFVVRAALNVARAVGKVHQTGCIIGDLNHSGVLVSQQATVALIDADSFQFRLNGKTYPCVVGVPEFTPPELHSVNLATVERTIAHDNFGLAVAIFHLLFMGRHPYAGRYNGPDISMGDAIAQNRFAFSLVRRSATQTTPPPGAPTLDLFPRTVRDAFERAFGPDPWGRPSASDWIRPLTNLESSLSRCRRAKTHYFPSHANGCIWCDLAGKSGFDMFPDLTASTPSISTSARATEQAIREILEFPFPSIADLLPQAVSSVSTGSSALREARNKTHARVFVGLLMMAAMAAGFVFVTPAWFIWLALGVWAGVLVYNRKIDVGPFQAAFRKADERVQNELDAFVRRNGLIEIIKVRSELDRAIASYKRIDDDLARELLNLKSTREARQRNAYLDQFSIRHARISGIGPAKTATLISFGIETAADVSQSAVLRVPGFGGVMTGKLMDWRRKHEHRFRYNPTRDARDMADERALRTRFASQKAKLETTIRKDGLTALRSARHRLEALPAKARSDQELTQALGERALAEQDLKLLGASIPNSKVTLKVATPAPGSGQQPASASSVVPPSAPSATMSQGIPNCPQCGASMRRRSGRYGRFWGCSRYPQCPGTRKI